MSSENPPSDWTTAIKDDWGTNILRATNSLDNVTNNAAIQWATGTDGDNALYSEWIPVHDDPQFYRNALRAWYRYKGAVTNTDVPNSDYGVRLYVEFWNASRTSLLSTSTIYDAQTAASPSGYLIKGDIVAVYANSRWARVKFAPSRATNTLAATELIDEVHVSLAPPHGYFESAYTTSISSAAWTVIRNWTVSDTVSAVEIGGANDEQIIPRETGTYLALGEVQLDEMTAGDTYQVRFTNLGGGTIIGYSNPIYIANTITTSGTIRAVANVSAIFNVASNTVGTPMSLQLEIRVINGAGTPTIESSRLQVMMQP